MPSKYFTDLKLEGWEKVRIYILKLLPKVTNVYEAFSLGMIFEKPKVWFAYLDCYVWHKEDEDDQIKGFRELGVKHKSIVKLDKYMLKLIGDNKWKEK